MPKIKVRNQRRTLMYSTRIAQTKNKMLRHRMPLKIKFKTVKVNFSTNIITKNSECPRTRYPLCWQSSMRAPLPSLKKSSLKGRSTFCKKPMVSWMQLISGLAEGTCTTCSLCSIIWRSAIRKCKCWRSVLSASRTPSSIFLQL